MGLKVRRFGSVSAFSPLRVTVSLRLSVFVLCERRFRFVKAFYPFRAMFSLVSILRRFRFGMVIVFSLYGLSCFHYMDFAL